MSHTMHLYDRNTASSCSCPSAAVGFTNPSEQTEKVSHFGGILCRLLFLPLLLLCVAGHWSTTDPTCSHTNSTTGGIRRRKNALLDLTLVGFGKHLQQKAMNIYLGSFWLLHKHAESHFRSLFSSQVTLCAFKVCNVICTS